MRFDFGIRVEGDLGGIQAVADWVRPALRPTEGESAQWFAYNLDIKDLDDEWEQFKRNDRWTEDDCGFMAIYPDPRLSGEFELHGEGYSIAPCRLAKLIAKKWPDLTVYLYDSWDHGAVYSECRMQGDTQQLWNASMLSCEDDDGNRVESHYRISWRDGVNYDPPLLESEEEFLQEGASKVGDLANRDAHSLSQFPVTGEQ